MAGKTAIFGVRAEDLHLESDAVPGQKHGSIKGRAFAVEPLGAETLLLVETEPGVECTARLSRHLKVRPGDEVELFFSTEATFLFDSDSGRAVGSDRS
jgi:multiple sugar transport system ATP-binding protein